jgi:hypothetical protein
MIFKPARSPLVDMRLWHARAGDYSFVISLEMQNKDPQWSGYMASWKSVLHDLTPHGAQPSNKIDGGPWQTFVEAETACKETFKRLSRKQ